MKNIIFVLLSVLLLVGCGRANTEEPIASSTDSDVKLTQEQFKNELIEYNTMQKNTDLAKCDKFQDGNIKEICIETTTFNLATSKKNPKLCLTIQSESMRIECEGLSNL